MPDQTTSDYSHFTHPKYEVVDLSHDHLRRCFEGAERYGSQHVYMPAFYAALYGFPVLEVEEVTSLHGFAKASENLCDSFLEMSIEFDNKHHPDVKSGGLYLNNGPSPAESLTGMEAAAPPLKMKGADGPVSATEARESLYGRSDWARPELSVSQWAEERSDMTVKARHLVRDFSGKFSTLASLSEAIKDPLFLDTYRHAGKKTTRQVANMLREEGALLYLPPYLEEPE